MTNYECLINNSNTLRELAKKTNNRCEQKELIDISDICKEICGEMTLAEASTIYSTKTLSRK